MAKKTPDEMTGIPTSLVYIAGNLADAKKAEQVLNDRNVDFAVSLDKFVTDSWLGRLMGDEYTGLFFAVPTNQHRWCCKWLEEAGLRDTVPLPEEVEGTYGA